MKLGVFTVLFGERSLDEALDHVARSGLETVELGCGGHPGTQHCNPEELLGHPDKIRKFRQAIYDRRLEISALSCHGNALHPVTEIAEKYHRDFENAVHLAEELEVDTVITFSGCPGESEMSRHPSWVTCPWPDEFLDVLRWQWDSKVIPYWRQQHEFLRMHGVRVAIEPHPGFVVYNTETSLELRSKCGDTIGVNFDPSHLFWQNMDPVASIKEIAKADALYHVHAKDTAINRETIGLNGVLDTKPYSDELHRSWIFRTVGYGHGEETWRHILSTLQMVGYSGAISIEHEDSLMSVDEGFQKAVAFLKREIIRDKVENMWWV